MNLILILVLPGGVQQCSCTGCTKVGGTVYIWNTLDYTPWIQ
jgi:hypothetical protein